MKNDYEVRGEVTAIFINSPKYGAMETLISTSKLERAKEYPKTWAIRYKKTTNTFYVGGYGVYLHRWILQPSAKMVVDHINHDSLDNTDSNLRIVTNAQNQQNRKGANRKNKSGIRGVSWHKKGKKWNARIYANRKMIYLGLYKTVDEAARVVVEARRKYMPFSQETIAQ